MRVTFVLPYADTSGGFRVIATYAQRLKDRGHAVTVVSLPPPPPDLRGRARLLFKHHRLPFYLRPGISHFDQTDVDHRVISRHRPITERDVPDADVIVATWWETAEWVWNMPRSKGAKAYFIQGYEVWGGPPDRVEATWRLPMQKIIISKWLMDLSTSKYGDPNAAHVPNSVDLKQFHAAPRGKQSRPTVGFQYSPNPWKGTDICLKAIELAKQRVPDLHVVSFGHDAPLTDMPLPPGSEFTAHPKQDAIRDIYGRCDAWICGSRTEGFHLPPLEAMACRCPVVSTKVGGPMDIVEEGRNGHLVEIEDVAPLADRLVRVVTAPDAEWRPMSDAAYAAAQQFTWDQATELFEAALFKAVERQQANRTAGMAAAG
jgi:glycosyltransferase involved in cell wall biosynthesis